MKKKKQHWAKVNHLPEHGPLNSEGKEILLSLRNVDITFGKGDNAVEAVKMRRLTFSRAKPFRLSANRDQEKQR